MESSPSQSWVEPNIYGCFWGSIIAETPRAILFKESETGKEVWLPKSRTHITFNKSGNDVVYIPGWLVVKKDLELTNQCYFNEFKNHGVPILEVPDNVEIPDELKD